MQKKESMKTDILNQDIAKDSEKKCRECWEYYVQRAKEDGWNE
jgi:hypothetical protein